MPPAMRYAQGRENAGTFPKDAFSDALAWRDMGGGPAAEHCAASALITLELYDDAAGRLEDLAQRIKENPAFRARILGQAGQAWLLAGKAARAEAVASAALSLAPGRAELMVDRAQARAALGDYRAALGDLDAALGRLPPAGPARADALVFRAAAKRFLGDDAGAMADAEAALGLDADHPDGLLERGILKRLKQDHAGARRDWLRVLETAPASEAARAARANLEKMDVQAR